MPRSTEWIIAHQDELAAQFENYEPHPQDIRDPRLLGAVGEAAQSRSRVESEIRDAVAAARAGGYSWTMIGAQLGTSGEAARQRYSALVGG